MVLISDITLMSDPVSHGMNDCFLGPGKPSRYVTGHLGQLSWVGRPKEY